MKVFEYAGGRIEGQFIWSIGEEVMKINLHAVDLTSKCEVRGTAELAFG